MARAFRLQFRSPMGHTWPGMTSTDQGRCDLLIAGGELIDGSGGTRVRADVAIVGDRVTQVGDLKGMDAGARIDAAGLVVAPGFIDAHTHDGNIDGVFPQLEPRLTGYRWLAPSAYNSDRRWDILGQA